jgi:tRNA threonylcarbamoyladenosine biosynthesis protein TsaE
MKLALPDEAATADLAGRFFAALPADCAGWTVLLEGELGSGKSTFARALIRAMGHDGPVPSPTYTLVEPYELSGNVVYHIDLYRVIDPEELRFLGFDELDSGLRLVEWADRAPRLEAEADVRISLDYDPPGRKADIQPLSARGATLVSRLVAVTATQPVN